MKPRSCRQEESEVSLFHELLLNWPKFPSFEDYNCTCTLYLATQWIAMYVAKTKVQSISGRSPKNRHHWTKELFFLLKNVSSFQMVISCTILLNLRYVLIEEMPSFRCSLWGISCTVSSTLELLTFQMHIGNRSLSRRLLITLFFNWEWYWGPLHGNCRGYDYLKPKSKSWVFFPFSYMCMTIISIV